MQISVITVCYNSAQTIADALRSVDAQSWTEREHLIVDGASSDATLAIAARHAQPWRRAVSAPDAGIYDAMNKGIGLARGEVIGFLNADDFYPTPNTLATVAAAFADPALDACYGDLCYVRRDDTRRVVRYWRSCAFRPGLFRHGWSPPHPTLYVRRRVYQRCGGFDPAYRIAADLELMLRLLEVHRIAARYLPEVLVHMRTGGVTNRSVRNIVAQNREIWRALGAHGQRPSLFSFAAGKLLSRGRQFLIHR